MWMFKDFSLREVNSNWLHPINVTCNSFSLDQSQSTVDVSMCRCRRTATLNLKTKKELLILNKCRDIRSNTWLICSCRVVGGLNILTLHARKEHLTNEASLIAL